MLGLIGLLHFRLKRSNIILKEGTGMSSNDRLLELCFGTDEEFLEKYLADASLEELAAFMKEFPDFMECEEASEDDKEMLKVIMEKAK